MRDIIVLGASGFIGFHLCTELCKNPANYVIGVDRDISNIPRIVPIHTSINLTDPKQCDLLFSEYNFDTVYQFAADSGNINYLNSKDYNYGTSTLININIIRSLKGKKFNKIVFPSSAYARDFELGDYGLEKKYNERLFRRSGLPIKIATLSNICGIWDCGEENEKVLNALCRKTAEAKYGGTIEVNNDDRLRSFVYIDDAVNLIMDMDKDIDIKSNMSISLPYLCKLINETTRKNINFKFNNQYPVDIKYNKEYIYTKDLKEIILEIYNYYINRISSGYQSEADCVY